MSGPLQKAHKYRAAGWMDVLWLPPRSKALEAVGYTGHGAKTVDDATLERWLQKYPDANIGIHLPDGVVGIDVDNYGDKKGANTWAECVLKWGAPPRTWKLTSRTDGISGIRLYKVPKGLRWPGKAGPGIEIIQTTYRYAVAWPSIHPDTGATYSFFTPDDVRAISIPSQDVLPELPDTWVQGMTSGEMAGPASFGDDEFSEWLEEYGGGEMCDRMSHFADWEYEDGSRHDSFLEATARVLYAIQDGHAGGAEALEDLHQKFQEATDDESRAGEWRRFLKVPAGECHDADPCENPFAGLIDNPTIPLAPVDSRKLSGAGLFLQPLSSVRRKRPRWIWTLDGHPWIPHGMLTLIAGREGTGKSQLCAWLVAQVTTGRLEGENFGTPGSVVYYAREDSKESTIEPRFEAAGADLDKVFLINGVDSTGASRAMSFPQDTAGFLELLDSLHDLQMVVFDPLISSMDTRRDVNNSQEIRATLEPVVNACLDRGITVVGLAHWTKTRGTDYNAMIQHSSGFAQLMRAGLSVMKFSDGTRRLVQNKSNLGPECDEAYAYDIEPAEISDPEGGKFSISRFVLGENTGENKQQTLSRWVTDNSPKGGGQKAAATEWLIRFLREQGGRALQRDIIEAGRTEGYKDSQLAMARAGSTDPAIHSRKVGMKDGWLWELDGFEGLVDETVAS